jgi:hypothetical protein
MVYKPIKCLRTDQDEAAASDSSIEARAEEMWHGIHSIIIGISSCFFPHLSLSLLILSAHFSLDTMPSHISEKDSAYLSSCA